MNTCISKELNTLCKWQLGQPVLWPNVAGKRTPYTLAGIQGEESMTRCVLPATERVQEPLPKLEKDDYPRNGQPKGLLAFVAGKGSLMLPLKNLCAMFTAGSNQY
ncbi:hypothetical protein BsWGS_16278 [Bradybaena similaris]